MAPRSPLKPSDDQELLNFILSPEIREDPLAFVRAVFPWQTPKTPLEHQAGPREWQEEDLLEIRDHLRLCRRRRVNNQLPEVFRKATVSGRGVGKSSLVSWLALWAMSTALGGTVIVTANTEQQLRSRTWAELGKWHTLALNGHWFERSATLLRPAPWFEQIVKSDLKIDTGYYYAQAQLWTEENPDAFAGAHNHNGMMVVFDEASGIPSSIWKVTEGFFTEPVDRRIWVAYSNGRRNTGAFFECFHKHRDQWRRRHLDSRTVEGTDTSVFDAIVAQYGVDSDEARVEVMGEFPRLGDKQFISREVVDAAAEREVYGDPGAPRLMGVDVARFGDDQSVIYFRQGRDGRTTPPERYKALDTVQLSARVAEAADRWHPDAIFVDGGGVGGGVVDRLKELGYRVVEVQAGAKANDPNKYQNKRIEMWDLMRQWLLEGCIVPDSDLMDDLVGPEYGYTLTSQMQLEAKDKMKSRGLASPDIGDALALTFAQSVARRDVAHGRGSRRGRQAKDLDYPLFG